MFRGGGIPELDVGEESWAEVGEAVCSRSDISNHTMRVWGVPGKGKEMTQ